MIKLHLGCGKRDFGPDWHSIDGGEYPHTDKHWHIITTLPYKNNTVDLIYASHVLEYFNLEEAVDILLEWRRVLRPGGILRLAVPDFNKMVTLYMNKKYSLKYFIGPLYGKMKMNDNNIYHKMVYDWNELSELLSGIGFKNIVEWDWRSVEHGIFDDHSQAYLPHLDKENGTLISLNIEATK